jgi:hypothetical protein
MKVAIRRIGLASLGRLGCVVGAAAAILPAALCGGTATALLGLVHRWLVSWQEIDIVLFGRSVFTLDLVKLMGLSGVSSWLGKWAPLGWLAFPLAWVLLALLTGGVLALVTVLGGLIYNLLAPAFGGVVVELVHPRGTEPPSKDA